jgi:hypothetical protein
MAISVLRAEDPAAAQDRPGATRLLRLEAPNGGELWLGQENFPVQWTAAGVGEKLKLVLYRNNVLIASIAEDLDPAASPFLWKIGEYLGGIALEGSGYKIRIRTMSHGLDDFSDAEFTLKAPAPVAAAEPAIAAQRIEPAAKRFRAGITFGRFCINDDNMKDFYLNWFRHIPGIEFSYQAMKKLDIWAAAKIYADSQPTPFLENESKFTMIPLSLGVRFRPRKYGSFEPFVGAGLNFYSYRETTSGDSPMEDTTGSAMGFHLQGGTYFHVSRIRLLLGEVFLKYNMVKKAMAEPLPDGSDKFDFGGLEFGIGVVANF